MKWTWRCNKCGAKAETYHPYYKATHHGRTHSKYAKHDGFDLTFIREDGITREDKSHEELVILPW